MAQDEQTEQPDVEVKEQPKQEAPKTEFVQLVKDAVKAHGSSTFLRVNLDKEVSGKGLEDLNEEYSKQGYEVFSNKSAVVLLKH